MKKWLTACLLAIVLLFAATSAMADHRKANGDNCIGDTFQIAILPKPNTHCSALSAGKNLQRIIGRKAGMKPHA